MTDQPLNGAPAPQPQVLISADPNPQKLPAAWQVHYNPASGEVAIVAFDATGQRWAIFDHESAARFAEDILRQAGIARTGLVLP